MYHNFAVYLFTTRLMI